MHVFSPRLNFLDRLPRSVWLSAAGGISTAYVFVHLLPELAAHQAELFSDVGVIEAEAEIFGVAMIGLLTFYGLERWAKSRSRRHGGGDGMTVSAYWLHTGAFALYNILIGYLLRERADEDGLTGLATYTFAMIVHFVVNDRGLYAHHGSRYMASGRWLLAVAAVAGALASWLVSVPEYAAALVLAFLGGGVVLNVMKEELPEERESRFSAFALAAVAYAAALYVL